MNVERYNDGSFFLRLRFQVAHNEEVQVMGYTTWQAARGWRGVLHKNDGRFHTATQDEHFWARTERGVRRKIARRLLDLKHADRRYLQTQRSK